MGVAGEFRHEDKFLIRYPQYIQLKSLLSALMQHDNNAGENGCYSIRSLYFDTLENRDYLEKESGIDVRRKLRMRMYMPQMDHVKLEIKRKQQDGIHKEAVKLSRLEAEKIIREEDRSMLSESRYPAARQAYRHLAAESYRPAVVIDYEREAFILPFYQIRITFDTRVRANRSAEAFFSRTACFTPVLPPEEIILEVKYNYMLPSVIRRVLSSVSAQHMAISKYYLSRRLFL